MKLIKAGEQLEILTLLKKCTTITQGTRKLFPRPKSFDVWDIRDMAVPLYDGPSLLAALRVLVGENAGEEAEL